MNTPEYMKAYLANLKLEIKNNNKTELANKSTPALQQYMYYSGNIPVGASTFNGELNNQPTNVQAKGTKKINQPTNTQTKGTKKK